MRWLALLKLRSPFETLRLVAIRELRGEKTPTVVAGLVSCLEMWKSKPVRLAAAIALVEHGRGPITDASGGAFISGITSALLLEKDEDVQRVEVALLYGDPRFRSWGIQPEPWILERAERFGNAEVATWANERLAPHRARIKAAAEERDRRNKELAESAEREKEIKLESQRRRKLVAQNELARAAKYRRFADTDTDRKNKKLSWLYGSLCKAGVVCYYCGQADWGHHKCEIIRCRRCGVVSHRDCHYDECRKRGTTLFCPGCQGRGEFWNHTPSPF